MKIHDSVSILEIPVDFGILNLAVIHSPEHGATLFDTAMPGNAQKILDALAAEGITKDQLKRIVITHADMDHIGSMRALKDLTGAEVISLEVEASYISGSVPPYKGPSQKTLDENPKLKAIVESLQRLQPDRLLHDGDTIPGTDAIAVATPGHTPGHMSAYVPGAKILITGDALTAKDGKLDGPMDHATPDMDAARASVRKLAALDVEQIVAYHGGLVKDRANEQLKGLAKELTAVN
jgi:glyoxylase-like metal-dependent hydrolase (beta-lactamase superfamily II)